LKFEPPSVDSEQIEQFMGHFDYLGCLFITVQVMTVTDMSAAHQDTVGPQLKGLQNEIGGDPP
jgi:hypothetical protein